MTTPRAFRLDAPQPGAPNAEVIPDLRLDEALAVPPGVEPEAEEAARQAMRRERRGRVGWGGLLVGAVTGLIGLWLTMAVERFVSEAIARRPALGYLALGLLALASVAAFALLTRELRAVWRARAIERLAAGVARARLADDPAAAKLLVRELDALYAARPETARARAVLSEAADDVMDGRDRIDLAERELMGPLDARAKIAVAAAARRVSLVTAISPRAFVDLAFALAQAVRLVRRVSEIYGGRPGFAGFVKVGAAVVSHLAVTGGVAVTDGLVQGVLGHSVAARLSARLGEGVLNGLLTARVGLSAISVCRPMPFNALPAPRLNDVAGSVLAKEGGSKT